MVLPRAYAVSTARSCGDRRGRTGALAGPRKSVAELKTIWNTGSKVSNWKDVRPGFPDKPIKLLIVRAPYYKDIGDNLLHPSRKTEVLNLQLRGEYVYAAYFPVDVNNQAQVGPLWSTLWLEGDASGFTSAGLAVLKGRESQLRGAYGITAVAR